MPQITHESPWLSHEIARRFCLQQLLVVEAPSVAVRWRGYRVWSQADGITKSSCFGRVTKGGCRCGRVAVN